jgi:ankyrin repeat protein
MGQEGVNPVDRCAVFRQYRAIEDACRAGDLQALAAALGDPPDFPNCVVPAVLGMGDRPLVVAISCGPVAFIRRLLEVGADPDYPADDGFPALIHALSTGRPDRRAIIALLLDFGADIERRGLNDWTALHYAVALRDLAAIALLLARGADPNARTRIDDCTTALEDADAAGFREAAALIRDALAG